MNDNLAALLYLVAGVLFILALRGLSSPETSRRGNMFGMIGMAIAVATTLASHPPAGLGGGAGRGLPFAGRHGGGAGRGRRVLRTLRLRHRHARRNPRGEPRRDVD